MDSESAVHEVYLEDSKEEIKPVIGYTQKELEEVRNSAFWKPVRYSILGLFWLAWAGLLAGATVIIVLNNGDVPATSTMTTTTKKMV